MQFVGPLTIERFGFNVTEVGYLDANIGIARALGHLCLTCTLAVHFTPEVALKWSLLACAVACTNTMALVSNQAGQAQQGEIMGFLDAHLFEEKGDSRSRGRQRLF